MPVAVVVRHELLSTSAKLSLFPRSVKRLSPGLYTSAPCLAAAGAGYSARRMPPVVTSNATIICAHGGQVVLIPKQMQVMMGGGPVLCEPDLAGAPIAGCAQPPSPSTKPCTMVVSALPGSTSLKVMVGGRPAYIATLTGLTDGVPPGTIMCVNPGQTTVQA